VVIAIDHLQKVIGESTVIDMLRVRAGEAAAVIGPAGSGKSELLSLPGLSVIILRLARAKRTARDG
jgi:ABC-type transporter Mla maintaining outer membrane lipid asymmetry ATPase subunit MlaF